MAKKITSDFKRKGIPREISDSVRAEVFGLRLMAAMGS